MTKQLNTLFHLKTAYFQNDNLLNNTKIKTAILDNQVKMKQLGDHVKETLNRIFIYISISINIYILMIDTFTYPCGYQRS